jgi:SAM-dependent methyltransferase
MLRIEKEKDLCGLRPQPLDMELARQEVCPCCESTLHAVAAIYAGQTCLIGACHACGYAGYMTRPTAEWFDRFYYDEWDQGGREELAEALPNWKNLEPHPIAKIATMHLPKTARICDIGCGYGLALHQLREAGFEHLAGIEKSEHRRRISGELGANVVESMSAIGIADVFTSFHVLEHVYDPDAFVREIGEHQEPGGAVFIGVPNQSGEPSMGVMLFLPHLHTFTRLSLCALFARHGYGMIATNNSSVDIEIVFRKGEPFRAPDDQPHNIVTKLQRTVHANGSGRLLWWHMADDSSGFIEHDLWEWKAQYLYNPRAVFAARVRGTGRYPVEVDTPWLMVK